MDETRERDDVGSGLVGNSGPGWKAMGETLFYTQCEAMIDRAASFSGMQMVKATEAHESLFALAPQLAAQ